MSFQAQPQNNKMLTIFYFCNNISHHQFFDVCDKQRRNTIISETVIIIHTESTINNKFNFADDDK